MLIWKCCPLIYSLKLCICHDPRIARAYPAQNTTFSALLACLAQPPSAFTSRCGTDKAGRGGLKPPPKAALERSNLTEKFQFRASYTEAETIKAPDQIPVPSTEIIILYIYTRDPHGCRHSPAPMLRVGQGSTSNCSIQYSIESKNRYHTTHVLRV